MTHNLYKILGFTKGEKLVWEAIQTPLSLVEIIQKTKLSRTTVVDILKRFQKRELLLVRTDAGKKVFVHNKDLPIFEKKELSIGEVSKVVVHKGLSEIMKAYEIHKKVKGTRWQLYMSNKSLVSILRNNDLEAIIDLNNAIRNNNQITELFVEVGSKSYFEEVKSVLSPEDFSGWIKSLDRMCILYEVPKSVFYNENDIFIFQNSLFITNWRKQFSIEISQEETVEIVKSFFEVMKTHAHKLSFADELKKYL